MKCTRLCLVFCTLFWVAPAFAQAPNLHPNDVLGLYWLPDRDGQFEIYIKDGRYFGRVSAYDIGGQLDQENADPSLRTRPFLGIDMFENFRFDEKEGKWIGGTIYDGTNGKTYDCSMWFEEGEPNTLVARGFIGFSFLGRNQNFDRVLSE